MAKIPRDGDNPIKSSGQPMALCTPQTSRVPASEEQFGVSCAFPRRALVVYFVIVVFKLHFQFQTSRHIVHIRYMFIRSFLIQRPPKCLKCLSFDILTCWYYETCWASVNDSAGDLASLTSTEIYFTLVFRNRLDLHAPPRPPTTSLLHLAGMI